ncbi:bacillithiol system redox-active protein YtxJ [Jeotgalibacillus sp. S-D1]|uniref:bacillithiol system redox-active protein YtxJ n=1 Tax=Jeotgalibacillus sp. S-D1 TaxID=2552189 RepID=UPI00196AC22B|nr:bacillithiol system redox-active protein YtxJ [Jeotgalibacillus sp. S-D1]
MKKIEQINEFDQLIKDKNSFFFMKHSLTCPISAAAYDEYKKFDHEADADVYYLAVQESRELSNHIAQTFGIRHESPQAIYFKNGEPVWNASHNKIKANSLKDQVKN